jgi:hypothetical protein
MPRARRIQKFIRNIRRNTIWTYVHYQLPAGDPSVVFLALGEIASTRLVKERVETRDPAKPGATQTQNLRHVEIEISGDTALLVDALQAKRGEQAPFKKRWYGTSSTLYRDYPVTMTAPTFLRIRWDVVPGAQVPRRPAPLHGHFRSGFLNAGLHAPEIAQPRRPTEATPRTRRPRPDHHRHVRRPQTLRLQLRRSKGSGRFSAGE